MIKALLTSLGLSLLFSTIPAPDVFGEGMRDEPVEILFDFPLSLGAIHWIEVEEASGLTMSDLRTREADFVSFASDSSKAEPGTWILVVQNGLWRVASGPEGQLRKRDHEPYLWFRCFG